jgi:hypothetical protein
MHKTQRIVLYGSTLVVSAIGESLRGVGGFHVSQIDPLLPDAMERLDAARPNVVLFDLAGTRPDFIISVLRKHPGLMLIGLDLESDKMFVMSGEESRLLSTDDLAHMIAGEGGVTRRGQFPHEG